jgi:hypothetical protein
MGKINGWDFRDSDANSKIQLINRQKSALNVDIIALDHEQKCGIFEDQKLAELRRTFNHANAMIFITSALLQGRHLHRVCTFIGWLWNSG